ncbi:hypothetical protein [Alkalihalophilus pseudofirmus]|uniref:hypothetical protein n=1 Tax=Alkalihalophilus pseudofirmus TaxID=79885 RepID=UPI0009F988BC
MKKMLYIWDIEKAIKEIVEEHNLQINYEFNNELTSPMSFNISTTTLKFNYLEVNRYLSKIRIKESKENLLKVIIYHELGYYVDYKKTKYDLRTFIYGDEEEIEQLKAQIETNAWEYGRTLVPEELVDAYDHVREFDKMLIKGL